MSGMRPLPAIFRETIPLMKTAWPIMITQVFQMGVSTTDILMLGEFDKTALAAAALGLSVFYLVVLLGLGPAFAASPIIAQMRGKRPDDASSIKACVRASSLACLALLPALWLCVYLIGDLLVLLGEPTILAIKAGRFVRLLGLGLPFILLFNVYRSAATALDRPTLPLLAMVLTILFDAAADYALIFGHFGAPRLGLVGAGIAGASTSLFSFVAILAVLAGSSESWLLDGLRLHKKLVLNFTEALRLGVPISLSLILETMFFSIGTLIVGHFGATAIAAHQIALNLAALTLMVPTGLAMATTIRVAYAAGGGNSLMVRQTNLAAIILGTAFMSLSAISLALFPDRIARLYVSAHSAGNAEVVALAAIFIRLAAIFQVASALELIAIYSLRGLKDTAVPMTLVAGCYWAVGLPLAYLLTFRLGFGATGVWLAFIASLILAAATLNLRFAFKTRPAALATGSYQ